MMDWVTLVGFVTIIGVLLGIVIPMIRSVETRLDNKMDSKFEQIDRKLDFLISEVIDLNRRLPAPPEILVASRNYR